MQLFQKEITVNLVWQSLPHIHALLVNNVCSHKITTGFLALPVSTTKMAITAVNPVLKASFVQIADQITKKLTIKGLEVQELLSLVSTLHSV